MGDPPVIVFDAIDGLMQLILAKDIGMTALAGFAFGVIFVEFIKYRQCFF